MKYFQHILFAALVTLEANTVLGFSATSSSTSTSPKSKSPIFEYLKFDANPTFDVLSKTKEYVETQGENGADMDESWYASDYVLRGPVSFNTGGKNVVGVDVCFKLPESNVINVIEKIDKAY